MAQVPITIAGRTYRMACADGEEAHLESLGAELEGRITELRAQFGEIGDQRLIVMAALEAETKALRAARAGVEQTAGNWVAEAAAAIDEAATRIERAVQTLNAPGRSEG